MEDALLDVSEKIRSKAFDALHNMQPYREA